MRPIVSLVYRETPLSEIIDLVRRAEERGADAAWIAETWREPVVPLAAAAAVTSRIGLAAGMAQVFPVNPVVAAQQAAHIQQLSNGRYAFGVALGSPIAVSRWFGLEYERPLRRMEEFVRVFKGAVNSGRQGRFSFDGDIFKVSKYQLAFESDPVPVYMAAVGPKMLTLAGRIADGIVIGGVHSEAYEATVRERILEGCEMEGRDPSEVRFFYFMQCSVSEDGDKARAHARRVLSFLADYPHYRKRFEEEGYGPQADRISAALREKDLDKAMRETPDEWVECFAVAGTVDECREQIQRFSERFDGTPVLYFVPYGVPEEDVMESVRLTIDGLLAVDYGVSSVGTP